MPTSSVGVGRMFGSVCLFVCLSVGFTATHLKTEWSQSVQTWYREWPWNILEAMWFWSWKYKGQGHRVSYNFFSFFHTNDYYTYIFWLTTAIQRGFELYEYLLVSYKSGSKVMRTKAQQTPRNTAKHIHCFCTTHGTLQLLFCDLQ